MSSSQPPRDSTRAVNRALTFSVVDGMLHAVMVGTGESYLGALAVELGHRDTALALLVTLPLLVGSASQLLAAPLARLLGGRKRLVLLGASIQGAIHLVFVGIAVFEVRSLGALLVAKSVYWAAAMVVGPPWGAWMATLTEGRRRERYFAWRTAAVQVALLGAFVGGGLLLNDASGHAGATLRSFGVLHAVALVARLASVGALAAQADPRARADLRSVRSAVVGALRTSDWKVPAYLATLMFGAYVAVPFFTPYMLRELRLGYGAFAVLIAVPMVVKALFFPTTHVLSARLGMRTVLVASGVGVAAVAALWAEARSFEELIAVQALSGVAWGGIEFASFQLLLTGSREEHRVEFLSIANTMSGLLQLAGSLLGGQLLVRFHLDYHGVFLVSAVGRALPLLFAFVFIPRSLALSAPRLFWRLLSVRPSGGTVQRPVFPDDERS